MPAFFHVGGAIESVSPIKVQFGDLRVKLSDVKKILQE